MYPFFTNLLIQAEIPFLLMVLIAEVETFSVIHLSSSGIKNFFSFRFGWNLRLVLAFELETLNPFIEVLPVKSQILDMMKCFVISSPSKRVCKYQHSKQKIQ